MNDDTNVGSWPFALFRGGAAIRSLSEHSGLSEAYRIAPLGRE
jgi:hypothetical protein